MAMRKTELGRRPRKGAGGTSRKDKSGANQARGRQASPRSTKAPRSVSRRRTAEPRAVARRATKSAARHALARRAAKSAEPHVRAQPLLAVRDVQASARWYARLLDAQRSSVMFESDHAHLYDRIMLGGALVLQLHAWDEEEHPNLMNAEASRPGHGVLVWFEVDDFDATVRRARTLKAKVVRKPHVNPAPAHREIWLEDLDGYVVVVASPDGEAEGR
jgi:hypothetical protein